MTPTSPDVAVLATSTAPDVAVLGYSLAQVPGGAARYARERDEARASGYAEGWAAGHRDAAARLDGERARLADEAGRQAGIERARHSSALTALHAAAAALHGREAPTLDAVADAVLDAALQLAEALVGHQVTVAGQAGATALRRALDAVGSARPVEVRLHPADLAALDGAGVPDGVTLVADTSLSSGDAVARHAGGSVDARLAAGLARAREVLRS